MEPADQIAALEKRFKSGFNCLGVILGNEAVNFTLDDFRRQSFPATPRRYGQNEVSILVVVDGDCREMDSLLSVFFIGSYFIYSVIQFLQNACHPGATITQN